VEATELEENRTRPRVETDPLCWQILVHSCPWRRVVRASYFKTGLFQWMSLSGLASALFQESLKESFSGLSAAFYKVLSNSPPKHRQ
jgi:hypothetical protein